MRIGFLCGPGHPTVDAVAALLEDRGHTVAFGDADADVYLLKSRTADALGTAKRLEARGKNVVNNSAGVEACLDRVRMAWLLTEAGIHVPGAVDGFPRVVKSRFSRRGDLVTVVHNAAQQAELVAQWPGEPLVVQPFCAGDGFDHKFWAVGGRVWAGLRRPALESGGDKTTTPVEVTPADAALVEACGRALGVTVFGVDVLRTATGPVVVDVNAFPGFRGVPGAVGALADLAVAVAGRPRR